MTSPRPERIILTPGPVTTSAATRQAMLRDYSLNEPEFLALTAELRTRLVELVNGGDAYVGVPLQGTGNGANEATLGTLVPRERRLLIVSNGFYGERLKQIAPAIGARRRSPSTCRSPSRSTALALDAALEADPAISHVVVCHVDTGTGLLNPIEPLAAVCRRRRVGLIVDAIASFGGLPLDAAGLEVEALVLSPNKWLEGVPGLGRGPGQARRPRGGRRPLPFLLSRPPPAVAELRGQRPLALHAADPGDRRAGRGAAPARRRRAGSAARAGAPQLALPGRGAAGAGLPDGAGGRGGRAGDRDLPSSRPTRATTGSASSKRCGAAASSCSAAP